MPEGGNNFFFVNLPLTGYVTTSGNPFTGLMGGGLLQDTQLNGTSVTSVPLIGIRQSEAASTAHETTEIASSQSVHPESSGTSLEDYNR